MPADYVSLAMQLGRLVSGTELGFVEMERTYAAHQPIFTYEASSKLSTSGETVTGTGSAHSLKDAKHEAARHYIFCLLRHNRDDVLSILDQDHSFAPATLRPPNAVRNGPAPDGGEATVHTAHAGARGSHTADRQENCAGSLVKNGQVDDLVGQLRRVKLEGTGNNETSFSLRLASDGLNENGDQVPSDDNGEFMIVAKADVLDFINNKMKPFNLSTLLEQQK